VRVTVQEDRRGEHGPRPQPNHDLDPLFAAMTVTVEVSVACSVQDAWALVCAVERIGEFSPECVEAWWVPGYPARAVGGRFEGRNRVADAGGASDWIRPCEVVVFDPPREFAWTVGDRFDGTPATRWAFRVLPDRAGCIIRQEFRHYPDGLSGLRLHAEAHPELAADLVAGRQRDLRAGMAATLGRMSLVLTTREGGRSVDR
jgi:uncharacterized protein YndB with AHSA1/START domain